MSVKSPNDKIVVEAEELPLGWKKEVKIRKGSEKKVDKFYTDPVTGYIFNSLKDVQRYLKTGELGRLAMKPKDDKALGKEIIKVEETEERSELKEQTMLSRNKRPLENGSEEYKTRSKISETGKSESPHRASKRLAGINIDASSPLEPKTRQATRLAAIKIDAPPPSPSKSAEPKTCRATRRAGIKIDSPPPSPPDIRTSRQAIRVALVKIAASTPPEPKTRQATQNAEIKIDASAPLPPEPKTRQAKRLVGIEINASPLSLPEPKTRQAKQLAGVEVDASLPSLPESKTRQATRSAGMRDNASPPSLPEPKTRRATRQAGIKIDSPLPSLPDSRTSRQATARRVNLAAPKENNKKAEVEKITGQHNENADMDNSKQEKSILFPPVIQESHEKSNKDAFKADEKHHKEVEMVPAVLPPASHPTPEQQPDWGIKINGTQELPPVSNPIPQDSYGGDLKAGSSMNFSMSDFWTDPCIEFAVKTLTGAIPFGDLNKAENFPASPSQVPMQDLWTDPCIEFAVKTLTGAIPVGENDYLQHQRATTSNPRANHDFSLPDVGMNFCQTDVLSKHFETTHNKQQDLVVNGGLLKNGNIVVHHQQVNGSNGQCSRSRFFQ